jgi:acetolactate synthase-1/2/3 large subunit
MARTTVADVLIDGLARAGVARLFATPDAAAAIRAAAQRRGVPVVGVPDAVAGGVLAAVTGEVGDGPGALLAALGDPPGLVRGLAHAQRDRAPVIVITADGADTGLLAPVVKASLAVEPASAGHWIAHAANLAMGDPRGPAHLVVERRTTDEAALPVATSCRRGPLPPPSPESLGALGDAIAGATRPLLVTGLECGSDDARWVRSLAEALPAPVLATPKGRGTLADPHPLALGALASEHAALRRADLVVLIGVDAAELRPAALGRDVRAARIGRAPWTGGGLAAEALGALSLVIEELAPGVRARPAADWDVAELDRIKRAVTRPPTTAARLVALAREATPAGTLATGDVAALAAWQAVAPRETLTPLGEAVPAYAVLSAIAAQLAHPDRRVVAFTAASRLIDAEGALALMATLALAIVVVALGPLDAAALARVTRTGVDGLASGGEREFALDFSRAFLARRPTVLAVPTEP